jgi:hypothetical protein
MENMKKESEIIFYKILNYHIMRKIYISGVLAVLFLVGVAAMNASINSQRSTNLSAVSLANIEALASGEGGCSGSYCSHLLCSVCCTTGSASCNLTSCKCK